MNKLFYYLQFAAFFFGSFFLISCGDDDVPVVNDYSEGVFVVNEGNFGEGDGSVTHFSNATEEVSFNIFRNKNNDKPLGDVVQSMTIFGDNAYIIVNNSHKVEVAEAETMKSIATIENVSLPRYMAANIDKGYLTEWVNFGENGRVAVIDLGSNSVSSTIEVGQGAEYPLLVGNNKLYVTNSFENTISIINTSNGSVEDTLTVANSPGQMVTDANGKVWVICAGGYDANWAPLNDGGLYRIDPSSNTVEASLSFGSNAGSKLAVNPVGDKIYYRIGNVLYSHDINSTEISSSPLITNDEITGLYGLGVDPITGNIYLADNKGFQGNGRVYYYQPDGKFIDSFEAGRGPNGFVFIP